MRQVQLEEEDTILSDLNLRVPLDKDKDPTSQNVSYIETKRETKPNKP